jgi:DNA repair protein RecN (Recombination protein N)
MLKLLKIKNFLLFKNVEVVFDNGFTVVTGETGSGKSMLIKALRFVLGEKLDNINSNESSVIAEFYLGRDNDKLREILIENDIDIEEEKLIIRRTNNKNFVNDTSITLKLLRKITDELVEFHSQHKQLQAFSSANSLDIIDTFGNHKTFLEKIAVFYQKIIKLDREIIQTQQELDSIIRDQEYITHSYKEIDSLDFKEGEELELIEKRKLFSDKVKIIDTIKSLLSNFNSNDNIIQKLLKSQRNLIKIEIDNNLDAVLESSILQLNELQHQAEKMLQQLDVIDNIDAIEERLSKIKELSRKYRCTADQLLIIRDEYKGKVRYLDTLEEEIKLKLSLKSDLLKEYFIVAQKLSQSRKKITNILEEKILSELKQLRLEQVEFFIELESDLLRPINIKGIDQVRFLIKTNKIFDFAPINEVASGGELSRIMLAVKVALAESNNKYTIIFDEIDSGTGGAVAQTIGDRMKILSKNNQIISISHQPQVAAKSDQHLLVIKEENQTNIEKLSYNQKIDEIARMLSGVDITKSAKETALSLMQLL